MATVVAWPGIIMEFEIFAEHRKQVLFKAHHEGMDPGVKDDVRAFPTHLGGVARREILHVDGSRDHGARNAETLADVAFHLRAEDHLGRGIGDRLFDFEVVVGDQRVETEFLRQRPDRPRKFAVVAPETNNLETHLVAGDAGGGLHMGRVAKEEHALAGEISAVDRLGPPGLAQTREVF